MRERVISDDVRLGLLQDWLDRDLRLGVERLAPASADASFRRYFRVWRGDDTFIVMDAPPDREDIGPFVKVAKMLARTGVHVPSILAEDRARGFLLLTDLGSRLYLEDLSAGRDVDPLYAAAMDALVRMQCGGGESAQRLPPYDRAKLLAEMELMPEWFCGRHLQLVLTAAERRMLDESFELLCAEALLQPQVLVHRDFHSRNLMVCPQDTPGILDFQDAVLGPVTYDLVSLLKDCYVRWPRQRVEGWVEDYRKMAAQAGIAAGPQTPEAAGVFLRSFDLMGVQRHIKVLGIFARLFHRDGKSGYLQDLPRVLAYTLEACGQYGELAELHDFLQRRVAPVFRPTQAAHP